MRPADPVRIEPQNAASTCLRCGFKSVVAHGGGFKCRDCGSDGWPEGGLPHGEHPYDYGYAASTLGGSSRFATVNPDTGAPASLSAAQVCERLEKGDCDDTDRCRAYGCRWNAALLRDEAIEELLSRLDNVPFGALRISVDHGVYTAAFATGVGLVVGEPGYVLSNALNSLLVALR